MVGPGPRPIWAHFVHTAVLPFIGQKGPQKKLGPRQSVEDPEICPGGMTRETGGPARRPFFDRIRR